MMERCYNAEKDTFEHYGGRGIAVCDRWHDVNNFISDMSDTWEEGLTLERRDNNGNYSPSNCKWATRIEQSNNRRNSLKFTYRGRTLTLAEWCRNLGIPYKTAHGRLRRGVPFSVIASHKEDL